MLPLRELNITPCLSLFFFFFLSLFFSQNEIVVVSIPSVNNRSLMFEYNRFDYART